MPLYLKCATNTSIIQPAPLDNLFPCSSELLNFAITRLLMVNYTFSIVFFFRKINFFYLLVRFHIPSFVNGVLLTHQFNSLVSGKDGEGLGVKLSTPSVTVATHDPLQEPDYPPGNFAHLTVYFFHCRVFYFWLCFINEFLMLQKRNPFVNWQLP